MFTTPPGRSVVSTPGKLRPTSAEIRASQGIATTVFPMAMAGITSDTNPSSGISWVCGDTIPTVPIASSIASATFRNGGLCTAPSDLSAHAAYEKMRSIPRCTSTGSSFPSHNAGEPVAHSCARCESSPQSLRIEHLRPIMRGALRPAFCLSRGFHRISNVFAVPQWRFAQERAVRAPPAPRCCSLESGRACFPPI